MAGWIPVRLKKARQTKGPGLFKVDGHSPDVCYRADYLKSPDTLDTDSGDRPMSSSEQETKQRNREIADNEAQRQTVSAIRVSTWAMAVAVIIALVVVSWVLLHKQ
jgi:hypothetical protein